ncbi:type 1 glutamine amidotransferase [Glaciecola sp. 33A]|uniref:type 1 glutamine amidotransferase n=1 Tax=Glaciecola sp. 33A TaxID=2057807 RepID=UPI000C34FDDA|nr:type 1 glutamine amidotransferase [Glaciecola sp. 33A]PKI03467.1 glutamine amidotransferase [Glaciecola sp. 33A]
MKILMMEGNTIETQQKAKKIGVISASDVYINAIRCFDKHIGIDVVNAAEGQVLPEGESFENYAGLVISGSSLRAFDETPEVIKQIDALIEFAKTGKPILGSCWGLQIAAIASGGAVAPCRNGRELGVARKISLTACAQTHPFMQQKPWFYDAPCIHYDEVTRLPANATLLCSNAHSEIQGAIIPVEKSEVWGVQYHPEFDIAQLRMLFELYKDDMLNDKFVENDEGHARLIEQMKALELEPNNKAMAWLLGIDTDLTDGNIRGLEILNWLNYIKSIG